MLCADHAVTSLVQLSLEAPFTRSHGALYAALAEGRIDEEAFAALLTATLPPLADGEQARAWTGGHDVIEYALLESALARLPDAECSPGREHVHRDLCRCDGVRKTIPGWEYQFAAAVGHTCAPRGPPSSASGEPSRPPAPARPPGRCGTCCAGSAPPGTALAVRSRPSEMPGTPLPWQAATAARPGTAFPVTCCNLCRTPAHVAKPGRSGPRTA